jgi:hypothetical protein
MHVTEKDTWRSAAGASSGSNTRERSEPSVTSVGDIEGRQRQPVGRAQIMIGRLRGAQAS